MEINIEKQQEFLANLGSMDGKLNALGVTINCLYDEQEALEKQRKDSLVDCQHVDDEGNLALSGGSMFVWCQICGKLLSEAEVEVLESFEKEKETKTT